MKKTIFIMSFLLMLMLSLVSATQYDFLTYSKPNLNSGYSDGTLIYTTESGTMYSYNYDLTGQTTQYATGGSLLYGRHYYNEVTDNLNCFQISTLPLDRLYCQEKISATLTQQDIGLTGYTSYTFVDDKIYLYNNSNGVVSIKDFSYNNVTHGFTITDDTEIFLNPLISGNTIYYNPSDNYLYFYDNETDSIIKSDLYGSYLGLENVQTNYVISDIFYINNTWFGVDTVNDTLVRFTNQIPSGSFYYFNGDYYSNQNCVGDTQLCTNTQYIINEDGVTELWCDLDDVINCDAICEKDTVTINGVVGNTGYCGVSTCTSECSFNGYKECTSYGSYRECGQFDSDVCLEYAPTTTCLDNQYCSIGNCIDYNFSSITDKTVALPSMYLKPTVSTDEGITTKLDTQNVYQISSQYNAYNQLAQVLSPLADQTFYNAYDCDYSLTTLIEPTDYDSNNTFAIQTNANNEFAITKLTINMNGSNDINLSVGNGVNDIAKYNFVYDNTTYNLLVYHQSNLLINDTGFVAYDDLESIDVVLTNDVKNHNLYVKLNRATPVEYQVISIDNINDASYIDLNIDTLNNVSLSGVNVYFESIRPAYDSLTLGDDGEVSCIYSSTGCYTLRSYVMGVNYNLYNNYEDVQVCVNVLGATPKLDSPKSLGDELGSYSLVTRLLIMAFVVGIIAVVFFVTGDEDNKARRAFGVGLLALAFILFVAVGMIPVWIILLVFVVIALFATGIIGRVMGFN